MRFRDRREAGILLGQALLKYKGQDLVVYALPRGGVVTAWEIAKILNAPLDLILAHKIGHPYHPEYAIGAMSENGVIIGHAKELQAIDKDWFETEKNLQMETIQKRREKYLKDRKEIAVKDKIAIIVDDGVATGLTMQAGIMDLKTRHPKKIIVAVPVAPKTTAHLLKSMANDFVGLEVPDDYDFLGAVGAYYDDFSQTEDEEVISLLKNAFQEKVSQ